MADEAVTVAETPEAPAPVSDTNSALDMIGAALRRQEGAEPPPEEPTPQDEATETDLELGSEEGSEAEPDEPEESEETEEAASESEDEDEDQAEEREIPDTLEGLAEQFGVDAADLAGHIRLTYTDEDGNPQSISFAEAVQGNLRQADYSRKTEELAQQRKAFDDERGQAEQALTQKTAQLDNLLTVMAQELNAGPSDQDLLSMLDPNSPNYQGADAYNLAKAERDRKVQLAQQAMAARQQQIQEAQAQQQEKVSKWRAEQSRRLGVFFPELAKDAAKQAAFDGQVREYLTSKMHPTATYSPEEVDDFMQMFDARQVILVDKAMRFDAMQETGKKLTKKLSAKPKAVKPGASKPRVDPEVQQQRQSLERLRNGGGQEAAINHIRNLLRKS